MPPPKNHHYKAPATAPCSAIAAAGLRMDASHRCRVRVVDAVAYATPYELDHVADLLYLLAAKPQAAAYLLRILKEYY